MENTKITSKVALDYVLNSCILPAEIAEKLQDMRVKLDCKRSDKPTPAQVENERLKEILYSGMTTEPKTITEYIKSIVELEDYSSQKITPIMKKLVEEGRVSREVQGKRIVYARVAVD